MTPAPHNPYAPPRESAPPSAVADGEHTCYRDGKELLVLTGTDLPAICVFTGQPAAEEGAMKTVRLSWLPAWIFLGIFSVIPADAFAMEHLEDSFPGFSTPPIQAGVISAVAVAALAVLRRGYRSASVGCYVSPRVDRKNSQLRFASALIAVPGLVIAISGYATLPSFVVSATRLDHANHLMASGFALLVGSLIPLFSVRRMRVRATRLGWFRIFGCSPAFLDQLPVTSGNPPV